MDNRFGYEDENTAPDGIWFGSDQLTRDVQVIAKRIKVPSLLVPSRALHYTACNWAGLHNV